MKDYKITNYRRANGVTIYTILKNDKIIASSSDYNKIAVQYQVIIKTNYQSKK